MSGFKGIEIDDLTLQGARRGDRQALGRLCQQMAAPVLTLCYRLTGDRALADDLTQETFVEVLRSISKFRGDASVATWVRRIAVSRCLMHSRSAWQRKVSALHESYEVPSEHDTASRIAVAADLSAALKALPESQRVVVWLHDVEGYTHQEIAEATGRTASYSKSCLSRARARLVDWNQQGLGEAAPSLCPTVS